jgi:hypothetical protein
VVSVLLDQGHRERAVELYAMAPSRYLSWPNTLIRSRKVVHGIVLRKIIACDSNGKGRPCTSHLLLSQARV